MRTSVTCVNVALVLGLIFAGFVTGQARAQESRLKPDKEIVIFPVITDHPKEIVLNAGGSQSLRNKLQGALGESWASLAVIANYQSAQRLPTGCDGYASEQPNLRIHYKIGGLVDLRVLAGTDLTPFTLVVRAPNNHFYCSELERPLLLSTALVWFLGPPPGEYDIWVAYANPIKGHKAVIYLITAKDKNKRK
ncbi:MAG TPA: hypothetical protein VEI03_22145 [Stellaceae bacterium]|nr:hypothetical protein [Stellaceae bacterium]